MKPPRLHRACGFEPLLHLGRGVSRCPHARSGREEFTFRGHTKGVFGVAFSPDGARLVTGSGDNTAKLWDARTGREELILHGHADEVHSVSFSPNGARLAIVSTASGAPGNLMVFDESIDLYDSAHVSQNVIDPAKLPRIKDASGKPIYALSN